jgi:23S rRNA pseudouridine1911/1915/1917 synthase
MIHSEEPTEELVEQKKMMVDKGQTPIRIDKFLFTHLAHATRTRIQYAAEAGTILVNDKPVKSSYKIKPGDCISFVLATPPKDTTIIAENIPIEIIFEDDDLMVINKKAGMVVHPAQGNYTGTLVNALLYYLANQKEFSNMATTKNKEDAMRPGLVHRLDKETSGLMIVAKNERSLARLAKDMFDRNISRRYVALVWGTPKNQEGTVEVYVGRSLSDRKKMAAFPEGNQGKPAITHYNVLENLRYTSLVECKLETGRTHQIRVHMKHIGHTIFGDIDYGGNAILKSSTDGHYKNMVEKCFQTCKRQALHAKYLSFTHPITKKQMHFEAPLPNDMEMVIESFRKYVRE